MRGFIASIGCLAFINIYIYLNIHTFKTSSLIDIFNHTYTYIHFLNAYIFEIAFVYRIVFGQISNTHIFAPT